MTGNATRQRVDALQQHDRAAPTLRVNGLVACLARLTGVKVQPNEDICFAHLVQGAIKDQRLALQLGQLKP